MLVNILKSYSLFLIGTILLCNLISIDLVAECRLCPEITHVKILLKNGVIRKGHIAINPEEELRTKPDRAMEVIRKQEVVRLYLSLDPKLDLSLQMPHLLYNNVYLEIPYKDIAKIELIRETEIQPNEL